MTSLFKKCYFSYNKTIKRLEETKTSKKNGKNAENCLDIRYKLKTDCNFLVTIVIRLLLIPSILSQILCTYSSIICHLREYFLY